MATATTDRQADGRGAGNRAPARGPRPTTTVLGATSAFLAAFAFLAWQMGSGKDPALGASKPVASAPVPVRREVIVRKVVITKVRPERLIVRERIAAPAPARSIPVVRHVAAPAAVPPPPAPVTHTASRPAPKPAPVAPAPKPAPAAPRPAPPTTHQS